MNALFSHIRHAGHADIPALVEMGRKFHKASQMPCSFDVEASTGLLGRMIDADGAVVLITDAGAMGGMLSAAYCDPEWVMAIELFWWAQDRRGLLLLGAFERWAVEKHANEVRMTTLSAISGPEKILARRGYKSVEISHMKVI